jgi:hypothetical protein
MVKLLWSVSISIDDKMGQRSLLVMDDDPHSRSYGDWEGVLLWYQIVWC